MQFSGATDVLGGVTNAASTLVTGGGAGGPTTFYNAVTNNGNINVSTGAAAVFLGFVNGSGTFSGSGTKVFDGGGGSLGSISSIVGSTVIKPNTIVTANIFNESAMTVQGTLLINGNGTIANRTSSLTISPGSTLDLANNDLVVNYSGASPATTIRGYLASAYNTGHWNGAGLASSAAAADGTHRTALGYGDAADIGVTSSDGSAIGGNAVIVKYTYYGDSSLDGKVDLGNDFNLFLAGYLGHGNSWELGDYNYDGKVDATDFGMFIDGFKTQGGSLGSLDDFIVATPLLSAAQKSSLLAAVPEPGMGMVSFVMTAALLRPRRGKAS